MEKDKETSLAEMARRQFGDKNESSSISEEKDLNKDEQPTLVKKEETEETVNESAIPNTDNSNDKIEEKSEKEENKIVNPEDKQVGDLGLNLKEVMEDQTTPAQSMANLKNFASNYAEETKEQIEELKKKKELEQEKAELDKLKEEKKEEAKFNDTIIEEKNDEKEKAEEVEKISAVKIIKPKDKRKAFNSILANRRKNCITTSVPLANSGYIAHMAGFSSPEIRDLSIALRTRDQFSYWDFLYQCIHDKIQDTSIGHMDYDTFLNSTALSELDILLYGIFCSTYPEKNDFPITCVNPACQHKFDYSYMNSQYLSIDEKDKSFAAQSMRALIAGQTVDSKEFFENSNTNTLSRVLLKHSGLVIELRHPTLHNQLYDVINQLVENDVQKASETTLNRMPYIEKVLAPVNPDNPDDGYYEFEDLMEKISLLTDLDEHDDEKLGKAISDDILSKYPISFKMQGIACPICGKKIQDQDVDFRTLLFTIHQIRIVSDK